MKSLKLSGVFGLVILMMGSLVIAHTGEDSGMHHEGCGMLGNMGGMMSGNFGFGGLLFGWLFSLLVIVALVLLIVWLIKQIQKK